MHKQAGTHRTLRLFFLATLTLFITACGGGGGGGSPANTTDPGNQNTPQETVIKGKA